MTSGAKTVDIRSNLIEKLYRGTKRTLQCFFFLVLPNYDTLEIIAIVCEKHYFLQIWPSVTSDGLNIDLT